MSPSELASRIAALDWSACSLQHQLAVAAAVSTLRQPGPCGETKKLSSLSPLDTGDNVIALLPKGAVTAARTVRILRLDGSELASNAFPSGRASAPWSWVRETVAALANVAADQVGAAEAESGDFVTVDGIPYCRVCIL